LDADFDLLVLASYGLYNNVTRYNMQISR
jgi:hypothetical protein